MRKTGFKPLSTVLAEDQGLAPIAARLAQISRLQNLFVTTLPPHLADVSRIAMLEGTTLIVATANGPTASFIKQMLPRLLTKLQENQKEGQEVTSIRVLVQPEYFSMQAPPKPLKKGEIVSVQALSTLAGQLSDSPLKEAVEKIRKKRERPLTK